MTSAEMGREHAHVDGADDLRLFDAMAQLAWAVKEALGPERRHYIVMSQDGALLVDHLEARDR